MFYLVLKKEALAAGRTSEVVASMLCRSNVRLVISTSKVSGLNIGTSMMSYPARLAPETARSHPSSVQSPTSCSLTSPELPF